MKTAWNEKVLLADLYPIPTFLSLGVIALVLIVAIAASVLRARRLPTEDPNQPKEEASSPTESVPHR